METSIEHETAIDPLAMDYQTVEGERMCVVDSICSKL